MQRVALLLRGTMQQLEYTEKEGHYCHILVSHTSSWWCDAELHINESWHLQAHAICHLVELGMFRRTMIHIGSFSYSISWSPSYGYLHRSMMPSTRLRKTSLTSCGAPRNSLMLASERGTAKTCKQISA